MCLWKFSNLDDILHRRYVTIFSTYVKYWRNVGTDTFLFRSQDSSRYSYPRNMNVKQACRFTCPLLVTRAER